MGLDNGFVLRSKSNADMKIPLATFRNFYELDRWVAQHAGRGSEDSEDYIIDKECLGSLIGKIKPVARTLAAYSDGKIAYYDDRGYPENIIMEFYGNEFSPAECETSNVAYKTIRLWHTIETMIEILDEDYDQNLYFTFYSSY